MKPEEYMQYVEASQRPIYAGDTVYVPSLKKRGRVYHEGNTFYAIETEDGEIVAVAKSDALRVSNQ